jgi:hypothetical protein
MGSSQNPTHAQLQKLVKAGQLKAIGNVEIINVPGELRK